MDQWFVVFPLVACDMEAPFMLQVRPTSAPFPPMWAALFRLMPECSGHGSICRGAAAVRAREISRTAKSRQDRP
jgi:hypothetical protein